MYKFLSFAFIALALILMSCGDSNNNVSIRGATDNLSKTSAVIDPNFYAATTSINPDVVKIKVYKIAFSTSA